MSDNASPLQTMTQTTTTALWNDSADPRELAQSIEWGAVGATCNPVIAVTCVKADLPRWSARMLEIAEQRPTASESQIGWQVVEEISIEAARLLEPAFEKFKGHNGRLSMQTDPRLHRDAVALADQAERFSTLAPNVIVKIPATHKGIAAIEDATARGVSMNVTVSFTVPQAVAAAEAIERGLAAREAAGHDVSHMGPVVTIMVGRLDDWLKDVVKRDGIDIDPSYLEWAGVAAFKHAYAIFQERGFRSRLLSAAFRNQLQWSEFVGGDVVISPPFGWQQKIQASGADAAPRMDIPVDPTILDALLQIPEFRRAYEPDGMTTEEFDEFGATRKTLRQFLAADEELDHLVREVILPAP
ncbi:MAG: transaldolase [Actinomycetales bacterium]|mgnify:FL=1|jgi:transaldolase|uniref:Transaldolase n=1 Tax=Candidatus Phosphoribacter hodrii TaxID=2953743 RepID=A0A935M4G3_9MICO|nr:transaldolase [Candidatus Phosphoribacter hodrii]OPZ55467.1 MAG: Transaldolase [bacterium ADurb.BinA028]HNV13714.1 transaldolase family protein [Dermatophilaceae bacterium]MBK7272156.1 transaldolase [Candidatus Phosphoribacter hodrii]HOA01309.1 transaldolase family protein [Dermatophilaceae bacterium]